GPVNVFHFGSGVVNVDDYLTKPICCPKFKTCYSLPIPIPNVETTIDFKGAGIVEITPDIIKAKIQEFRKLFNACALILSII
ncbi:MAG TPA: hypothetical protein VIS27_13530, partial [Yeosuana sp.]